MHFRHLEITSLCYGGIFISIMIRSLLTIYEEYTEKGQQIYRFKPKTNPIKHPIEKSQTNVMHNFYKNCAAFGKYATVIKRKD